MKFVSTLVLGAAAVFAQQPGNNAPETHPKITTSSCTSSGCQTKQSPVVLDSNWRWTHKAGTSTNCYDGNEWDTSICPDGKTCAENCAIDGADYPGTYGIHAQGNELSLGFVTEGPYSTNIGSRTYLMADESKYEMFKLANREFTFDVDVSNLPCGLNGALYFVEMPEDGGASQYPGDKAGAKFGTGYCDAQCPHDIKFINGEANVEGWKPSPTDPNSGTGKYGSCCTEMDIWEANSISSAVTPHVCQTKGQYRCEGTECGDNDSGERYKGLCDKDGCDFNPQRMGNKTFFGPGSGFAIDTTKKFTVVTQFITSDGTDNGDLVEIRRQWVQDGKVVANPYSNVNGVNRTNSITDQFCNQQKDAFGDTNDFEKKGGLKAMGEVLKRGMVLVLSLWDDHDVHMLWLDSKFPTDQPVDKPGVDRGSCSIDSGKPEDVQNNSPHAKVMFSSIKTGTIGSTYPSK